MKKPNAQRPAPLPAFPGDLARQKQINRDVDALFGKLPVSQRIKPIIKKTGTALCILLLGATYGIILGVQL